MSAKLKAVAVVLVLAAGSAAIVTLRGRPEMTPPARNERGATDVAHGGSAVEVAPLAEPAAVAPLAEREAETPPPESDGTGAASAATAVTCVLEGRVLGPDGGPVDGAYLLLEIPDGARTRLTPLMTLVDNADELLQEARDPAAAAPPAGAAPPLRHVRSDASGRFRFEGIGATAHLNLAALHERAGLAVLPGLVIDPARPPLPQELRLPGGIVMTGDVTDPEGAPIHGARIFFTVWHGSGEQRTGSSMGGTTTNADGRYRTLPLPWRDLGIDCYAQDFIGQDRSQLVIPPDEAEHREDFQLQRRVWREGAIVLADGSPARLATIDRPLLFCASSVEPTPQVGDPRMLGDGKLDRERDRWSTDWEHARWISLWCERTLLGRAELTEAAPTPDLVVDLSLLPAPEARTALELVVVDGASGAAVAAYQIDVARTLHEALEGGEPTVRRAVRDAEGRARFEALRPGRYEVTIRAEGFAPSFAVVEARLDGKPVELALQAGSATITGVVVDAAGAPLSGRCVDLLTLDGTVALPHPEYRALTNAEGAFVLQGVPDGDYFVVSSALARFAHEAGAPAAARATAGDRDVRLVELPALAIKATLRFPAGVFPMYQLRVRDEMGVPLVDHTRPAQWMRCAGEQQTLHLPRGAFTVEVLAPRHYGGPVRFVAVDGGEVIVDVTEVPAAGK